MKDPEQLAAAHWKYVEGLLELHRVDVGDIEIIGWHYRSAMVHGFKHGVEAAKEKALILRNTNAHPTGE